MVERGHCTCQHDGLDFAAANSRQKIHALGQRGHGGHKTQCVLTDLVRRRAQDIAITQLVGCQGNVTRVFPTAAQVAFGYTQMPVII